MVVDCSGWIEPLNLECLLVNTFAGSLELFMFIALLAIAVIGTTFKMINMTILIMYALFAIIMSQYITGIYFLAVLIAGLVISFGIGRLSKI